MISIVRKDGHSQRDSLANNLPANAADMVKAVHGPQNGHARAQRQEAGSFSTCLPASAAKGKKNGDRRGLGGLFYGNYQRRNGQDI
jgi:hypothetical protein